MSPEAPTQWNVLALLNWTKAHLERAGVPSPRLAAEMLLAHAMGCRRIDLYTRFDYLPTPEQLAGFRESIRRAAERQPVAYLVGEKEFYSLRIKVTPDVLVPRPETEILVAQAVEHLRSLGRPGCLWDVCTGSGCVALAVASQVADAQALATDCSPAAVAVAAANAAELKLAERVRTRVADLLKLPEDCADLKDFDVITANPPYIPDAAPVAEEVKHEPAIALRGGRDGLDVIRVIVRDAPALLRPGGALIMEYGYDQAPAVRELVAANGAFAEPKILRDHQSIERAVMAIRK